MPAKPDHSNKVEINNKVGMQKIFCKRKAAQYNLAYDLYVRIKSFHLSVTCAYKRYS
jgi:hypothetical protein